MDTTGIPKTFWHALSLACLAFTVVLCYIAIRATSVTIKYKDAQVDLLRVEEQKDALREGVSKVEASLKEISTATESLSAERKAIEAKQIQVDSLVKQIGRNQPAALPADLKKELERLGAADAQPLTTIPDAKRLDSVRKSLESAKTFLEPTSASTPP